MTDTGSLSLAAYTLGCKVNQCDTEALLVKLIDAGLNMCSFNQSADIYIINTCTVTHTGDKKSLQMIRRARRLNPAAFVAVCGCMPRGQADSAGRISMAGADFTFDARKPEDLLVKLNVVFPGYISLHGIKSEERQAKEEINGRTRAFIKIQDGCNRFCAYCIVPYVRGPVVSRAPAEILAEVALHIRRGVKEIVLTGIQVAAYGYDTGNGTIALPELIKRLADLGPVRVRLSSIDPWAIDDAFLETTNSASILCDHFHLSLQSGADKTLARMNRRYTTTDYATAANKLKNIRPDMALTTDMIVGFPGESADDFVKSLRFAGDMGFARIHVFEYSPRVGTPAADMPDQVPSHIKSARGDEMRALAKTLEQRFLQSQIGKQVQVLFESKVRDSSAPYSPEVWQGRTTNYCLVKAKGANLANTVRNVQITGTSEDGLIGNLIDS